MILINIASVIGQPVNRPEAVSSVEADIRSVLFCIPKRLRVYFIFDRSLLAKLSRCARKVLNLYLTQAVPYDGAKAGAAVALQSFDDFQNFHPHLHVLSTDGCFYNEGGFIVCPHPKTADLEKHFR